MQIFDIYLTIIKYYIIYNLYIFHFIFFDSAPCLALLLGSFPALLPERRLGWRNPSAAEGQECGSSVH